MGEKHVYNFFIFVQDQTFYLFMQGKYEILHINMSCFHFQPAGGALGSFHIFTCLFLAALLI